MVFYFYFYPQILTAVSGKFLYVFLFASISLALSCLVIADRKKGVDIYQFEWIVILVISTFRNVGLQNRDYLWPITFIALIFTILALGKDISWCNRYLNIVCLFSTCYIIVCFVFYCVPSIYSSMVSFWGYYPNGTEMGRFGYRAGLADNHSANGTYCSLLFLIGTSVLLSESALKRERKKWYLLVILAAIAVILTTKRAHLVFSLATSLVTYYIFSTKRMNSKLFGLLTIILSYLTILQFVQNTPYFSEILGGFLDQGTDISNGRFDYWIYAISIFMENPIFGIGWLGFRHNSSVLIQGTNVGAIGYVDAHNVYVQLLCETGIIGTMFISAVFLHFISSTIRFYMKEKEWLSHEQIKLLSVSFSLQFFCLIYGMTGNFLYDRTCFIYVFGCALFCAVKSSMVEQRKYD